MVGHAMDRGGLKDSENASNSFIPKINRTVFWDLGADMYANNSVLKLFFSKKCKIWLMNQKSYFMLLEAAWKAVHLTQVVYL